MPSIGIQKNHNEPSIIFNAETGLYFLQFVCAPSCVSSTSKDANLRLYIVEARKSQPHYSCYKIQTLQSTIDIQPSTLNGNFGTCADDDDDFSIASVAHFHDLHVFRLPRMLLYRIGSCSYWFSNCNPLTVPTLIWTLELNMKCCKWCNLYSDDSNHCDRGKRRKSFRSGLK